MGRRLLKYIWKASALPENWIERVRASEKEKVQSVERTVKAIINEVKKQGNSALIKYTKKFDRTKLDAEKLQVAIKEIENAYEAVTEEQISAIKFMKEKIETIERLILKQARTEVENNAVRVCVLPRPIESVGCYVPGGRAAYPSTLAMAVVPAKLAGVPRIVVCSPPTTKGIVSPLMLVAADICGVDEVYRIGGVQAIAALAYGTESIKPVRKIVGPGNKYVTMAKILVSREVAIDMPAGPSEILILADESANPRFIALDMISQAEHGVDSIAGLITTSKELAEKVLCELEKIVAHAYREAIVKEALLKYGFIITCENVNEIIELANLFAPEHVEVLMREPMEVSEKVMSAGAISIGPYSPVSLSDYCVGTNHVLPTSGFGRVFSGLSALNFVKRVSVVECSMEGLSELKPYVKVLAEAEDLPNHYKAIEGRFKVEDAE